MHFEFAMQTKDGLLLHGRDWRPERAPAAVICLVHGQGEHSGRYAQMAGYLNRRGFGLLAFDLRGHGKSEGQRGHTPSYEALMDDIAVFLAASSDRYPAVPVFLYGHSMGGNLAINYTLRRRPPLSGVIATAPLLRLAFEPPRWKTVVGRLARMLWPTMSTSNHLPTDYLSRDPDVLSRYRSDPLVHDRVTVSFIDIQRAGLWALSHAAEFPLPLLLMQGSGDRVTSPEASEAFAEGAGACCTLKIWEGLYHEIHNEPEREAVYDRLVEWLEERGMKRAAVGEAPQSPFNTP